MVEPLKRSGVILIGGIVLALSPSIVPADAKPTFVTLDIDGTGDTSVAAINSTGEVIGEFDDCAKGFTRTPDGTVTIFDAPAGYSCPFPTAINKDGYITGQVSSKVDNVFYSAGFIRAPDGTSIGFSVTGNVKDSTSAFDINAKGDVVGLYVTGDALHGFVRKVDGSMQSFDVPGAQSTIATQINDRGVIAGEYTTGPNEQHGFLRANGKYTTFDVPGAVETFVMGLNNDGWVTGNWHSSSGIGIFVRLPDGTINTYLPGYAAVMGCINKSSVASAAGGVKDYHHGFLISPDGSISTFGIPGEKKALLSAPCVNDHGVVAGTYRAKFGTVWKNYGFVRTP